MKAESKTTAMSETTQTYVIMEGDINGYGRLFGGRLMEWIDLTGGVTARRHANRNVTTAFFDSLEFLAPAYLCDLIVLVGKITYVGNTSMEIRVDASIERLDGERKLVNRAYLVYVALDENGQPIRVPRLERTSEEENAEWDAAVLRRKRRQALRSTQTSTE